MSSIDGSDSAEGAATHGRVLRLPAEATVSGGQHRAPLADGPAMARIGESDCVE